MIGRLDATKTAELVATGAFEWPRSERGAGTAAMSAAACAGPLDDLIAAHFDALAAYDRACHTDADDERVAELGAEELRTRRALFAAPPPTTLRALADFLDYALAFSVPAWRDSDPEDEPIDLLKTASNALRALLGP